MLNQELCNQGTAERWRFSLSGIGMDRARRCSCDLPWLMSSLGIFEPKCWGTSQSSGLDFCDESAFFLGHSLLVLFFSFLLGVLKANPSFSAARLVPTSSSPLDTLARVECGHFWTAFAGYGKRWSWGWVATRRRVRCMGMNILRTSNTYFVFTRMNFDP